jgi:excisionase family DNA binding protein
MARDTYTSADASRVLGISERRVRQLVSEGKLPAERDSEGQLRIPQQSVITERKRRNAEGRGSKTTTRAAASGTRARKASANSSVQQIDVQAVASAVAAELGKTLDSQKELTMRAESFLREELDAERARRVEAEEKLAQAEARLAEVERLVSGRKLRMFRRKEAGNASA